MRSSADRSRGPEPDLSDCTGAGIATYSGLVPAIDSLAHEDYISLTTFKRNGTGVATPVWVMRDGDHLFVLTDAASGKAKRLRNFSRVMVAPCDMRGRVTGSSVDATAELLDDEGTRRVHELMIAKYGIMARAMGGLDAIRGQWNRLRRRPPAAGRVGIRLTLAN